MPKTGALYIFGDSLSDDGATAVQLQDEPIDLYFAGRASNGLVWHEYIRNDLAVAPAASAISQAPNAQGYLSGSAFNGINFAHGGAVSSSNDTPTRPGTVQQAEGFAALVASGDIPAPDDQDVFVIWIGGNDFLQFADASIADIFRVLNLGSGIVDNIETTVESLIDVGARNILLIGQPTIGGAFLGDQAPEGSFIATVWNRLTENFNEALADYASELNAVDGQSALFVDIASFIDDLQDHPAAFGFANVTSDILTDGADVLDQTYFSVDGVHPTGAGHAAIAAYISDRAAEAGFDLTALAGNVVPGSARDDTLTGTDGNDTVTGGAGDDVIDGKGGADIAVVTGAHTGFTLKIAETITLIDRSGAEGRDTLTGIETVTFDDTLFDLSAFDDAAFVTPDAFRSLTEIYISYFDRAPDALGLMFWADVLANGTTLPTIADFFAASPEAQALFPDDQSAEDFVTAIYANTLGRAADADGFAFWTGVLTSGAVSASQFILEVLKGARADAPQGSTDAFIAQQVADRAYLETKVDLGLQFAAILGLSDVTDARAVMDSYTGTSQSLSDALSLTNAAWADALATDGTGAFLVELVGVVEAPFEIT
ncbi:MAG: SGNH/GDSL hydrolase family protein [Marivita sp.]|uniref:SGNH/GDSL hydrolase family protein n=1 Tax=Marivita sp. TaxID=2003365 RepID=UPI003EF214F8